MEEKTDKIKKESRDKIMKFKGKNLLKLNNVIVKRNGNDKTKHYLTPRKYQKEQYDNQDNIKVPHLAFQLIYDYLNSKLLMWINVTFLL